MLSPFISKKFRVWSFVAMVFLVFVHGYNLEMRYMQPATVPGEPMTISAFLEYFIANGILRFRIPMLFVISGFLFALHDGQPHRQRMMKRVKTLLTPYLLWSAFGLAFTYLLELYPPMRDAIASSHIAQATDQHATVHEYYWYEFIIRWIFFPVPYQLWFIRVLLIYNLAYPLIRKWVTQERSYIYFTIVVLLWLTSFNLLLVDGEGLLFFSLGVWMQKTSFDIERPSFKFDPMVWGMGFILLTALKTWLAFVGGEWSWIWLTMLHKVVVGLGLIVAWYGMDKWVRWFVNRDWLMWLSSFSFIIYALHAPLVAYLIDPALHFFSPMEGYRMMTFVALPVAVIFLCIACGWLLRLLAPGVYRVMTGGRGK